MEKWPEAFQSLPWVTLPVTRQDWTDLLPSLATHFWPNSHRTVHILPSSSNNSSNTADQAAGLLCQCRSHQCGITSPGAFLPRCPITQTLSPSKVAPVSAFWGGQATGSSFGAVFPTSWQSADTRGHLPFCHTTQTELTQPPHQLQIPMCPTKLSRILIQPFQALSPKLLWCLGFVFFWATGDKSVLLLFGASQQKLLWDLQSSASHRSPCTHLVSNSLLATYCHSPSRETPSTRWQRNTDVEKIKTRYTVTHD